MTDDEELIEIVGRAIEAADSMDRNVLARAAIAAMQPRFKAERIRGGEMVKEAAGALVERLYLQGKPHERHPLFIHNAIRALSVPAIVEAGDA